jgi:hypothetical protein
MVDVLCALYISNVRHGKAIRILRVGLWKLHKQAYHAHALTATERFGTSMSAGRILRLDSDPRVWLFAC